MRLLSLLLMMGFLCADGSSAFSKASSALNAGLFEEALQHISVAQKGDPKNAEIHRMKAFLHEALDDSKNALDKDIKSKKDLMEKEIEKEILKAQKEISELKKNSISSIQNISENITSNIIENISGDKLNESSIKAAVKEISNKNLGKYL